MTLANTAMLPFLRALEGRSLGTAQSVNPALAGLADKLKVRNGSAVLERQGFSFPSAEYVKQSFTDWTGFECFTNAIHIEDFYSGADAIEMLRQAMGFSKLIQDKMPSPPLPLRFIVSLDKFEGHDQCVFKFHVIRASESWLAEDIEGYKEPVLTWTSSESVFLGLTRKD